MKINSKSNAGTEMAHTRKQNEVSPIELHLKRGAEIDNLRSKISKIDAEIIKLFHRREKLIADL